MSACLRRLPAVVAAGLLAVALAPATASGHVYWTHGQSPSKGTNDRIGRANLDATMLEQGFVSGYGMEGVTGVAVDASHVYWSTDYGFLGRSDLDGTNVIPTWVGGEGEGNPYIGVAAAPDAVYWANTNTGRVGRADLDGTDVNGFYVSGPNAAQGVAVTGESDPAGGHHLFWGDGTRIGRLDFALPAKPVFDFLAAEPLGIATDGKHLYWIEADGVHRSGLDGTGAITLATPGCGATATICGVAVDADHVYWTRYAEGTIARANLDGSGVQADFITGLTHPTGVAVDGRRTPVPPASTSPPLLSGTPQVGQVMSCSTGTWSGDGPLTFTYAWRRNGALIAGASASTYLLAAEDAGTTIQCEVTAGGPGGTSAQASGGQSVTTAPPPPAGAVPPAVTTLTPKAPAKIRVLRAGVSDGVLDMLVEMTSRAAGPGAKLDVKYLSSGRTTTFSVPIAAARRSGGPRARAAETSIRIRKKLPAAQRAKDTGIVELTYAGSSTVQADGVRLRAATGKSRLQRETTKIENGRLIVSGTVTREARGVVRIRLGYDRPDATTAFLYWNARIRDGAWLLDRVLPVEAAKGGQLSIQFTGYEPRNLRGEQTAKQVLPG